MPYENDGIVPEWDLPPQFRNIVPEHDLPEEFKTANTPVREPLPPGGPVAPVQITPDQMMEMIAQRLSGPIRDMYEADVSRGIPHDDAMMRVLNTTQGQIQGRNAYREIITELSTPQETKQGNRNSPNT